MISTPQRQLVRARLGRVLTLGLDLLFPARCVGCGRVGSRWCAQCQQTLEREAVALHLRRLPPLVESASTGLHDGQLQQTVHALKYEQADFLAVTLGHRLIAALDQTGWTFDMIVPVPLHMLRQRERGYNQSQLLGETMAQVLGISCLPSAIERWRATPPQVGLNRQQRQANVHGAFRANPALVTGKTLLLIDDVFTTGATLQACARAALDAGAQAVYSLTVTEARN